MATRKIEINRAPVLTLWLYVVALRLKYKKDEALSIAKYVGGATAQAHVQALGIYAKSGKAKSGEPKKRDKPRVFTE